MGWTEAHSGRKGCMRRCLARCGWLWAVAGSVSSGKPSEGFMQQGKRACEWRSWKVYPRWPCEKSVQGDQCGCRKMWLPGKESSPQPPVTAGL